MKPFSQKVRELAAVSNLETAREYAEEMYPPAKYPALEEYEDMLVDPLLPRPPQVASYWQLASFLTLCCDIAYFREIAPGINIYYDTVFKTSRHSLPQNHPAILVATCGFVAGRIARNKIPPLYKSPNIEFDDIDRDLFLPLSKVNIGVLLTGSICDKDMISLRRLSDDHVDLSELGDRLPVVQC
jgi:hypothetical protein